MAKNKKTGSLLLPDKALAILEFYKESGDMQRKYVFPELEKADQDNPKDIHAKIRTATKKFNNNLKKIAAEVGITKKYPCTLHVIRLGTLREIK